MAFDGSEGEQITLTKASGYTKSWRENYSSLKKGIFIGRDKINDILNQADCKGIRIYFGIDDNSDNCVVLVGAEANENDMENGIIIDNGVPCPSTCGVDNDLNSD